MSKKKIKKCAALHANPLNEREIEYPVFVGHRGKTKRKRNTKKCFTCGSEAELLLITLPSNRFLRPRTEAESKAFQKLVDTKKLDQNHAKMDRMRRKMRLCPQHIKPLQKQFGVKNVGMWGQKK